MSHLEKALLAIHAIVLVVSFFLGIVLNLSEVFKIVFYVALAGAFIHLIVANSLANERDKEKAQKEYEDYLANVPKKYVKKLDKFAHSALADFYGNNVDIQHDQITELGCYKRIELRIGYNGYTLSLTSGKQEEPIVLELRSFNFYDGIPILRRTKVYTSKK